MVLFIGPLPRCFEIPYSASRGSFVYQRSQAPFSQEHSIWYCVSYDMTGTGLQSMPSERKHTVLNPHCNQFSPDKYVSLCLGEYSDERVTEYALRSALTCVS